MTLLNRLPTSNRSGAAGGFAVAAVSGLLAGVAYVLVQEADLRLTGRNVDDLAALGRFVVDKPRPARVIGLGLHLVNSAGLGLIYARAKVALPGPPWARGVLFAMTENALFYPLTMLEDKHPAIQDGTLDRYWNWPAFMQSIPRHIVYGAVLGALEHNLRHRWRWRHGRGPVARRSMASSAQPSKGICRFEGPGRVPPATPSPPPAAPA